MPRTNRTASENIAASLRQRIASGEYQPGDPLPSNSKLRAEFHVADGTVRRALAELAELGLTTSRQGRPPLVAIPGQDVGTLYERVLAGIRSAVNEGRLEPGSPLPSEAELAEEYGVGRGTVRIAVAELERSGEVVNRPGRRRMLAGGDAKPEKLYERIASTIRYEIAEGGFIPGAALPSEAELCEKYETSRVTIRRALSELEAGGVVERGAKGERFVRGTASG